MADQFIALSNELIKQHAVGDVGAAVRYAAARFAAYEADLQSPNLSKDREYVLTWFTKEYNSMLLENIDEHIRHKQAKGRI